MSLALLLCAVTASARDGSRMVASWYGERFRGRPTASGELFDPDALTAAHPTLPFGTVLELVHPDTGAAVRVRVNDRGPSVPGRELDVSEAAAEALGMRDQGVAKLEVTLVDTAKGARAARR